MIMALPNGQATKLLTADSFDVKFSSTRVRILSAPV